jgi:hypothetical protein
VQNLRVLITTYHQAYLLRGGGEYELLSIADGLRQMGITADIYGPYSRSLEFYDVVLHFSVMSGGLELLRHIKASGKPVVLWPNLWAENIDESAINVIREHIELADFVAFKSNAERNHLCNSIPVLEEKLVNCKTVADMSFLKPASKSLFQELYGIQDYALWIGLIEPLKNQLMGIRVLREKGIPLVVVGRYRDEAYYRACCDAGGSDVLFLEGLPQRSEIVRSALQNAKFYIEISHEPAGLSALEAGLSGCKLLLSDSDWSRQHFEGFAEYVDPYSFESVAAGVDRILDRTIDASAIKEHLLDYCFPNAMSPLVNILQKAAG